MRFLLKLVFVLFVIALAAAITGFFLPSNYKYVHTEEIPVSRTIVYEQIVDFRKWQSWSPWIVDENGLEAIPGEVYSGQQATMELVSESNQTCKLTMTHAVGPESVAVDFDFGLKTKITSLWYVEPTYSGCKLNWTMNITKLSFFERYMAFLQKDSFKELLGEGTLALKEESLKLKYSRTGDISSIDMPAIPSVIMVDSVVAENVEERLVQMDAYLKRFFERRELKPTGGAYKLVYGRVNDTLNKIALGYPVESKTWVWRTLEYHEIPEGEVLTVQHFGLPEKTKNAHDKLFQYINQSGYSLNGIPWEVSYFKGDSTQTDTSMWLTQVFVPVIK